MNWKVLLASVTAPATKGERHGEYSAFLVRSSYGSLAAAQWKPLNGDKLREKLLSEGMYPNRQRLRGDSQFNCQSGESLPAAVAKTLSTLKARMP